MRKIKLYTMGLLLVFLSSCNEYLDLAPETELIKDNFWSKTEDVNSGLAATYNAFRNTTEESLIWGELRGDMIEPKFDGYSDIKASLIVPTNWVISWSRYYSAINLANTLILYSEQVMKKDQSFTLEMKNGIEAEALFIRSLCYFYLVRLWKDIPIVTAASISDTTNIYPEKSKEHVVIQQIISDLLIAKDKAFTNKFIDKPAYYKGRANKYAIMALLADVYLWSEQYQKAIEYCNAITNTGLFDLESGVDWFNLYHPGNSMKESIFEIQYDGAFYQWNPISGKAGSFAAKKEVQFPVKSDDRQMGANKYVFLDRKGTTKRTALQRDANYIYYRYADIILIKAEALNELGNIIEANELYKKIVFRATGENRDNITNKNDLRQAILDERAREFFCEGKRWFDLLRTAKRNKFQNKKLIADIILKAQNVQMQAILKPRANDTNFYYLPIPDRDIKFNPNLVQNPFYDR